MTIEEQRKLEIRCPHCLEDTEVNLAEAACCKHCKKTLIKTKFIKPIMNAGSAFAIAMVVGLGGGSYLDDYFERERYPIAQEYSIIERSISSDRTPVSKYWFLTKKKICIEALKETQKEISYQDYEDNPSAFMNEYERQLRKAAKGW